jgi:DNA-3-methyladenine glycosylase II
VPRVARRAVVEASEALVRQAPQFRVFVEAYGPADLRRGRPRRTHFAELVRAICYQQLAGAAARTIHGRLEAALDGHPTPEAVLALPLETLRAAGLSANKAASVRDLAEKVLAGDVELDRVARLSDDRIVEELTLVRGIGRWTAEMFLMFQLGRLDVWPVDDLGVRKGYAVIHGLPELPVPRALQELGEPLRPYRSLAAWYCWRAVDTRN